MEENIHAAWLLSIDVLRGCRITCMSMSAVSSPADLPFTFCPLCLKHNLSVFCFWECESSVCSGHFTSFCRLVNLLPTSELKHLPVGSGAVGEWVESLGHLFGVY